MSTVALDVIDCLPTMDELDSEPLVEELSKAIDSLASGKAPGNDGIPPQTILQLGLSPVNEQEMSAKRFCRGIYLYVQLLSGPFLFPLD